MRKLLLSILSIVGVVSAAYAEKVEFNFVNNTYGMTRLSGTTDDYNDDGTVVAQDGCPVQITLGGGAKATRLWSDGVRFYKGSKFTVSAPGYLIKSVTFGKNHTKFNLGTSALSSATWSGSEESITFTCNITSKNTPVNTLTIEYEKAGDPTKADAGLEYTETSFTIEEGQEFTAPTLVNPNGLAVTYSSSDEAVAAVAADGTVTVNGAGTTTITATSAETDKYNAGSAEYTLTVLYVLRDAAEVYTLKKGDKFVLVEPVTVFYVNGKNVYAYGSGRNILLYNGETYEVGTTITRLEGTIDVYSGLIEIIDYTAVTDGNGASLSPKTMNAGDITADNIHDFVLLDNASISGLSGSGKDATITHDGGTIALRNTFNLDVAEAQNVKIAGIVCVYASGATSKLQVQPTAIVDVATGIDEIEADNAPAEYYNLQGVKVADDTKGMLIRRQGDKTVKIVVK